VAASPLINESGESAGGVLVIRDETRIEDLERELSKREGFYRLVGKSEKMQRIYTLIQALSDFESTVLVTGESGTGKELVAEALHYTGARRDKPLVKVNCSALSENLLESELFGHVRGAFTGAVRDRKGRFEEADGGTIFLDEIGDLSPKMQVSLLRVLQEREFEKVGDSKPVKVDVRVIAATNKDLRERLKDGCFREDLYYRLKVVELNMPPLRERREDIPLLVDHFMAKIKDKLHKDIRGLSAEVEKVFMTYAWPGNVRELEHVLEHSFFMCRHDVVTLEDLPADFGAAPGVAGHVADHATDRKEVGPEDIIEALEKAAWNKTRASVLLGMSRSTLYRKIQEHRISVEDPLKKS
jgi:transcriptional regulator with PAS, ATPase and Fis domain